MSTLSSDLCGKIKVNGAPGVLGMGVDDIRNEIIKFYKLEGKSLPSLKGLSRCQLCHLLSQTTGGFDLIKSGQSQKTPPVDSTTTKKTPIGTKSTISPKKTPIGTKPTISPKKTPIGLKNKPCPADSIHASDPHYVCNPLTGNWIKIGGEAYNNLVKQGIISESKPVSDIPPTIPPSELPSEPPVNYCDKLGGLLNDLQSCYLDSTLLSLFFTDNDYVKKNILDVDLKKLNIIKKKDTPFEAIIPLASLPKLYAITESIQKDLKVLRDSIHEGKVVVCTLLRQHLGDHQKIYETEVGPLSSINWKNDQQEPLDVMVRLDTIFSLPDPAIISLSSYGTNLKKDFTPENLTLVTHEERKHTFKVLVDAFEIGQIEKGKVVPLNGVLNLDQFISQTKVVPLEACNYFISADKKKAFSTRIEILTFLGSPLLYVHLGRVVDQSLIGGSGKTKLTTKIIPPPKIKMSKGKDLELSSMIIHHGLASGGHYTGYLNCQGIWYYYNDVGYIKLVKIGDYEKLMKDKGPEIFANATDYFYM